MLSGLMDPGGGGEIGIVIVTVIVNTVVMFRRCGVDFLLNSATVLHHLLPPVLQQHHILIPKSQRDVPIVHHIQNLHRRRPRSSEEFIVVGARVVFNVCAPCRSNPHGLDTRHGFGDRSWRAEFLLPERKRSNPHFNPRRSAHCT
jgi:hypothetical protein